MQPVIDVAIRCPTVLCKTSENNQKAKKSPRYKRLKINESPFTAPSV